MVRQLDVWLTVAHPGTPIGTLTQAEGRLAFRYRSEWLASDHATPLSQSLPLQADEFDDRATRPFFAGLLPEGDKRRLVAQALGVSRQNDFALLDGIGGECAGDVGTQGARTNDTDIHINSNQKRGGLFRTSAPLRL